MSNALTGQERCFSDLASLNLRRPLSNPSLFLLLSHTCKFSLPRMSFSLLSLASSCLIFSESESRSVVSDSLRSCGLYSPWNSQARILKWVAFLSSRGSFQPRDRTQVSCTRADSLPTEPQGKLILQRLLQMFHFLCGSLTL